MAVAKFLGMVRVWNDGDEWRWVPVGQWAPEEAVIAKRYKEDEGDAIYIEHSATHGEFIRGAVKA